MTNNKTLNLLLRILLVICVLFIFYKIYENYNLIKSQLIENKYNTLIILIIFIVYQILLSFKNFFLLKIYSNLGTTFIKWQEVFFTSIIYNFVVTLTGTIYRAKKIKDFGIPYLKYVVMLYFNYYVYIVFSLLISLIALYFLENPFYKINYIVILTLIFFLSLYFIPNIFIYLRNRIKLPIKNFFFIKILYLIEEIKKIFKDNKLINYSLILNILIISLEIIIFYLVCEIFYNDLSYIEFLLLYIAKFLLDIIFMTASLFGFNEVLYAVFSLAVGFKFELTLFIKVTYRVLLMFSALINLLISKLLLNLKNTSSEGIIGDNNFKDKYNQIIAKKGNKNKYLVTVIIPYYNNKYNELSKAINSVLKQKKINFKTLILVVDDHSKNPIQLKKLKLVNIDKKIFKIKIYRKIKNEGDSKTRLKGVKLSKSKFIAFLDSDDFWHSNKLYTQMKFLIENRLSVVGSNWNNRTHFSSYFNTNKEFYKLGKKRLALQWWPHISTVILEKNFFYQIKANKISNLRYGGDGDLLLKLASTNNLFILKKNLVTCHYFKKKYTSSGMSSSIQKMNKGEIIVLKNNFDNSLIRLFLISWIKFKYLFRVSLK